MQKDAKNHLGHFERIREKVISSSPYDLEEIVVVEMLLQGVFHRTDTNEIARSLLNYYGTFQYLYENATEKDLLTINGIGKSSARKLLALLKLFKYARLAPIATPISCAPQNFNNLVKHIKCQFENVEKETFVVFLLDKQKRIVRTIRVNSGDTKHVVVDEDEIVDIASKYKCTNIVCAHNHLNESFYPSIEDVKYTTKLLMKLKRNGLTLLDHVIVSRSGYFSFTASRLMGKIIKRYKEKYSVNFIEN